MYKLDPAVKTQWAIGVFTRTIFWVIFFAILDFFVLKNHVDNWIMPTGFLPVIIFLLGLINTFLYPYLAYKFWQFEIRDDEVFIERGIFTRIMSTAPFLRIQHLDVEQSVMDRILHLGKLVIYTAGTRGADLNIPGLPIEYAEQLRDHLKNVTNEDAV